MRIGRKIIILPILLISLLSLIGCSGSKSVVYDGNGQKIGMLNDKENAYIELAKNEAIDIISENESCSNEEAAKKLEKEKYKIYTAFDKEVYDHIDTVYNETEIDELDFGCTIVNSEGMIIAAYSKGESGKNFAVEKNAPYSAFKPLSVYAPYFEKGGINWSKMYEDSPVKTITRSDGSTYDWPTNASNTYLYADVTVCEAIRKSYNTIAVKCLEEYGVRESIEFLESTFGIDLEYEKRKMNTQGYNEIIGNIALGYLEKGVSTTDMAGYYQVFENGGKYQEPKTILKIEKEGGEILYEFRDEAEQVISEETAFVMNQLLQEVVKPGGTGFAGSNPLVDIGGKTGTGSEGNWFVGFSPEYCCAIWHGTQSEENVAATLFANVFNGLNLDSKKEYPGCGLVSEMLYCQHSGQKMSKSCKKLGHGYYISSDCPPKCELH